MKHYRIYKLDDATKKIAKPPKIVVTDQDEQAVEIAKQEEDCPLCEVWEGSKRVGTVE